ncbi:DUF3429 domain-containing protein [Methylocystis sp. WRRC1]|uniref:DUF3429 domain-containing protein n=1 Tax=Methylocystis sp. WRRC1 TaxID=1732014 RepID=UPI001D14E948|nr:DUF3429 domain-containing protein [Methylocystis sp. WRRC1]MCC3246965.1 DUF3429 domain-containing protein [Methylocystis sp. WRRC1]
MSMQHIVPPAAKSLGYAGALPFLAGALLALPVFGVLRPFGLTLLLGYGAIILSFMGGVHWGVAMAREDYDLARLARSVAPSIVALAAFVIGGAGGLVLLASGFGGLLLYDEGETRAGRAPGWYPYLRRPLTATVAACLLVGAGAQLF